MLYQNIIKNVLFVVILNKKKHLIDWNIRRENLISLVNMTISVKQVAVMRIKRVFLEASSDMQNRLIEMNENRVEGLP